MALHARGIDARTVPAACERSIRSDGASAFDSAKAADAARSSGAAATLAGTVEAGPDGTIRGTPLLGAHASAALLLVEPNGRIAGEAHVEREGYGADPAHAQAMATDAALDAALASLSSAIASTWPAAAPAVEAGSTVTLHVAEWQRYADLQALLKSVSVLPGVSAVEPHRFTPRAVDVLVRSPMSSAALASALARAPGGRFLTTARDDGSVGVRISPEAPLAPQGQPAPGAAPPSWGSPAAPAPASGLP